MIDHGRRTSLAERSAEEVGLAEAVPDRLPPPRQMKVTVWIDLEDIAEQVNLDVVYDTRCRRTSTPSQDVETPASVRQWVEDEGADLNRLVEDAIVQFIGEVHREPA